MTPITQTPTIPPIPENLVPERTIMLAYRGSVAHGMWLGRDSIDDIDLMGVFVGPANHYIGFGLGSPQTREIADGPWDVVHYEIRHFISLLAKANPNVLSMLWIKPEFILQDSATARTLRSFRHLFATRAAYHSFTGYAYQQLQRMTRFDGPERVKMRQIEEEVLRRGFTREIRPEQLTKEQAAYRSTSGEPYANLSGKELVTTYREMRSKYTSGYQGEKRRKLVEEFGFDCKNASHLVRLLRMGVEFLRTGELLVDRRDAGDAEELLAIKRGEWSLEQVQRYADEMFAEVKAARDACTLPDEPDMNAIEMLCMDLICREVRFS